MEQEVQQNDSGEIARQQQVKKHSKVARGFSIFGVLVLVVILIVLIVNALLSMFMEDYYTTFGDYRLFSIVSDSMEPTIPKGSMIVGQKPKNVSEVTASSSEGAKDGTVITFKAKNVNGESILLTHRVVSISTSADGKTTFTTRGDNPNVGVDQIHPAWEDVVGIYTGKKCGFFGALFGFFASSLGASVLIFVMFIVVVAWITIHYVNKTEERKALETAALKKSSEALSTVNLRYDNIHEITAVLDVLGMVTEEPKNMAENRMIAERLNEFIRASTFELPQTPETAAILDTLPAPDTPGSLAAALSAGATLRQAEDGQTLILTTMSGGKNIMLTPVNTPDGIILCQQGVRIKTDIAPNIEAMGITSMPAVPEFFEGQPLEKNVEYPELPQPGFKIGPDVLLSGEQANAVSKQLPSIGALAAPQQEQKTEALPEAGAKQESEQIEQAKTEGTEQLEQAKPAEKPKKKRAPLTEEQKEARRKKLAEKKSSAKSHQAYLKYRELTAERELKRAAKLRALLAETAPLTPEEQLKIAEHKSQNPPKKRTRKPLTPEQKAKRKAAAERRKKAQEAFLNTLTPEDRELYLTERKLAKSRNTSIRQLKRIEADRKLLDKIDE